jgi:HK97 family phage portal protein
MSVIGQIGNWIGRAFTVNKTQVNINVSPGKMLPVYADPKATRFLNEGFCGNASIYTIISKKARKFAHIRRGVYKIADKQAYKSYRNSLKDGFSTQQTINRTLKLQTKAYENEEVENDLSILLNNPNPWQGQDQFFELLDIFYETIGEGIIWCNRGDVDPLMSDDEVKKIPILEMYIMPPQYIEVLPDPDDVWGIIGYVFVVGAERRTLRKCDIIHWRKPNPQFDGVSRTHLRGLSPLKPGNRLLQQDDDATDATVSMYQNGGAKGVAYDKSLRSLTPKQDSQLDDVFERKINNKSVKAAVARVQGDWGYLNVGMNSVDMELLEGQQRAFVRICNLLDTPPALFLTDQTYENALQSIRNWINNSLIPAACSLRDEMNRVLLPAFDLVGKGITTDIDPSDLPELQADFSKLVSWLANAWWLTGNQRLDYQNEEKSDNPLMDEIIIPSGMQLLSDLNNDGGDQILNDLQKRGLNDYGANGGSGTDGEG